MSNPGRTHGRMIEIISPAGFENFFRELAHLAAAGRRRSTRSPRWRPATAWSSATPPRCPTSSSARSVTAAAKFRRFSARLPSRDNVDSASGEHTSYAATHI